MSPSGLDDDKLEQILTDINQRRRTDTRVLFRSSENRQAYIEYLLLTEALRTRPEIRLNEKLLKQIDEGKIEKHLSKILKKEGYLDSQGKPTKALFDVLNRQVNMYEKPLNHRHADLLRYVESHGTGWQNAIVREIGLVSLKRAWGLQKAGYISNEGKLSPVAKNFLVAQKEKDFAYYSKKFSSKHTMLFVMATKHGRELNEELFRKLGRSKEPWAKVEKRLQWLEKIGALNPDWRPTELGKQLRLSKVTQMADQDLRYLDTKIEKYLKTNQSAEDKINCGLQDLPDHEIESRIFRLCASDYLTENNVPTESFTDICEKMRLAYSTSKDPPWIIDKRTPKVYELTTNQKNALCALAFESPYLSEKQLKHHLKISDEELRLLKKGRLLNCKNLIHEDRSITCVALNNKKVDALMRELGVEKPLRGKFNRHSHAKHDLLLWESLQTLKQTQHEKKDKIEQVLHERAIYQMKTSANDNKGISTPDLVVKTNRGSEIAIEFGNYRPSKMIEKVMNFPQKDVAVFTDDTTLLEEYKTLFIETIAISSVEKNVQWFLMPEINL